MTNDHLRSGERLDDLHRNGYKIIQNEKSFCFGIDAILLTGFAQVRKGEKALDLGTGTGIIPILLAAKTEGEHFTGLEILQESVDMAGRSVKYNHLEERISIVEGDIREAENIFKPACFDVVTSNPPYMTGRSGLINPDRAKAIAKHEICCTLEDIISQTSRVLKVGGRFYLIHRPFRLAEIICTLTKYKLEPKKMQFVHSFINKEANMVLVEAVRGGRSAMKIAKPLVVYKEPGVYTDEIYEIYGYDS